MQPGCNLALRTADVDALVIARYPALSGIALLAVGGYGRRELFPYSDIDLLFVASSEADIPTAREAIAEFLQSLWDCGLRVSQSVHTAAECLSLDEGNAELAVSLLDPRFLAGDSRLFRQFGQAYSAFLEKRAGDLIEQLVRLTRERHRKFQDTIFHLEPNVKDGPGGMRDFQVQRWVARLSKGAGSRVDAELVVRYRCALHELAGRDSNVLTFEAQDRLAALWGNDAARVSSDYFLAARRIRRALKRAFLAHELKKKSFLGRLRGRGPREPGIRVVKGQVEGESGVDALRLFTFVARQGLLLSAESGRAVHDRRAELALGMGADWARWRAMLELPYAPLALREMHETGLLAAAFPEFARVDCLVIRDFFHQYTVDEHTLVAIETVAALKQGESPRFGALARETAGMSVLFLALLFHDTGKGDQTGDHAAASARLARPALERIGMPEREIETVLFLIDAHLAMGAIMNSRDLSDPETARTMAERAGTVERLRLLTLLTYADSSAVNATAMTAWRASLLWQLYTVTDRELTRELQSSRIGAVAETADRRAFLEGLPTRYLRTHEGEEIDRHIIMERAGTAVWLEPVPGAYCLTLVTRDRPFLFASVAGAISSFGMNIVKAEAFGNARGAVIELFTFTDPIRTLELNAATEPGRMEETVKAAALGTVDVERLLAKRRFGAALRTVEPRITVEQGVAAGATLFEVVAEDRAGLLYDLASAISRERCNIESLLVNTEARRAIDVFYVSYEGGPVPEGVGRRLAASLERVGE